MSIEIVTFGCRLNTYESEVMRNHAQQAGLSDTIIFNTCAVTAEAERSARHAIRKAKRENPHKKIIVTGCAAQIHPEDFGGMAEVDAVLGNAEKMHGGEWSLLSSSSHALRGSIDSRDKHENDAMGFGTEKIRVNDIMAVRETASHMVSSFEGRARAFLQVQNGCDHRCTFCIIPFGRGPSRSVPIGEITTHVRALVEAGFNEVVFTGVDVSDYGKDLPGQPTLGQMIRRVLAQVPELPRLRLSSIDAVEVDDDLYRLIAEEPRLMPHLHISIQAGDDMVLKRMKRRHLRADIIAFCERVRALRPDMAFGADIIAGFPTETDAMFENTLRLVEEVNLTHLHVFPYSARKGTPAARMPQVAKDIRKERAARLRAVGDKQLIKFLNGHIGKEVSVVIENNGLSGHSEGFALVKAPVKYPVGSVQKFTVAASTDTHLVAAA